MPPIVNSSYALSNIGISSLYNPAAVKFCNKLMDEGHVFTIVDEEQVHEMIPKDD